MTIPSEVLMLVALGLIGGAVLAGLVFGQWWLILGAVAGYQWLKWWVNRESEE